MDRYLSAPIKKDSDKKIILLSGPRQSGKTTLTKQLLTPFDYLNRRNFRRVTPQIHSEICLKST